MQAGVADAGSVDGYVWDTLAVQVPGSTTGVRVAWRSPTYGFPPIVARRSLGEAEARRSGRRARGNEQQRMIGKQLLAPTEPRRLCSQQSRRCSTAYGNWSTIVQRDASEMGHRPQLSPEDPAGDHRRHRTDRSRRDRRIAVELHRRMPVATWRRVPAIWLPSWRARVREPMLARRPLAGLRGDPHAARSALAGKSAAEHRHL